MTNFSDLGIEYTDAFSGRKILTDDIIGLDIIVRGFVIERSKFQKKEGHVKMCVILDLVIDKEDRIFRSGSEALMWAIQKVPKDRFPIKTIIITKGKSLRFS